MPRPKRAPSTTLKEDVANLSRAVRGATRAALGSYENVSPASKLQKSRQRKTEMIDKEVGSINRNQSKKKR